ncbi:MAG: transporter [Firmicutes bacterium]|jgi:competence protein ComEA|nr:transporter [Bacillota bacterium]
MHADRNEDDGSGGKRDLKNGGGVRMPRRDRIIIAVLVVLLIVGIAVRFSGYFSGMERLPTVNDSQSSPEEPSSVPEEEAMCTIHIIGAVVNPGIYELPIGARVHDVVNKAGGPAADADLEKVNLARPLVDGEQVHIPLAGEEGPESNVSGIADGKVNINRATLEELTTLTGIGEKRARNIIEYRDAHGPFSKIEEIMNVPNIGAGLFEGIKENITVY